MAIPAARDTFRIMKEFHDTKNSPARAIRVAADVHRLAKVFAAEQGVPLGELAAEALAREVRRRQGKTPSGGKP